MHANTVYARFERVEDATGLDPQQFHALTELLLATDLSNGTGYQQVNISAERSER